MYNTMHNKSVPTVFVLTKGFLAIDKQRYKFTIIPYLLGKRNPFEGKIPKLGACLPDCFRHTLFCGYFGRLRGTGSWVNFPVYVC